MIPTLKVNLDFYKSLAGGKNTYEYFKYCETPYDEFGDNSIPIYLPHTEIKVGEYNLFNEYKRANLLEYGCCPTEMSLINYLQQFVNCHENYLVTAKLVTFDVAMNNHYGIYVDESGEDSECTIEDYFSQYGYPEDLVEYDNKVIKFCIYELVK